jgi:type VI protein secretion system component Hcp
MGEHSDPLEQQQNVEDDSVAIEDLDVNEAASAEVRGGVDMQPMTITKTVDVSSPKPG